jgi:hypothetical protein
MGPAYGTLYQMLTNPIYGGGYLRVRQERARHALRGRGGTPVRPQEAARARFERIGRAIRANLQMPTASRHHGAARTDSAMLAGLIRCRRCAAKLTVHYTGTLGNVARYACHRAWLDKGAGVRCMRSCRPFC